jgi:pSer/pThr/pTyr-binding forkhead associated (FHA) protein
MLGLYDARSETATSTENRLSVELTIQDHCGRETQRVLHKLPAIIGRDVDADVPLVDPWISHRHCEISQIGDVLVARDLQSKNGIFMHSSRVHESYLKPGDRLTLGRTEVTVHFLRGAIEAEVSEPQKPLQDRGPDTLELL